MKRNFKQQGSIIFTNINKTNKHKKDHDIDVGNLAHWKRHNIMAWLIQLMRSQRSTLDDWISNGKC